MGRVGPEMSNLDDCDFWCRTDGDKIERGGRNHKTRFVWQVKNFSSRPEQKGEFIESDSFTVISLEGVATKWKLQLFPKGNTSAKDGHFSVFLKVLETKAIASFKILISDENGKKIHALVNTDGKGKLFKPGQGSGRRDPKSKKWLFDDVLTLVCEVSVLKTYYNINQNHRLQMMEDLGKAFKGKNSLDVTVKCGDTSFKCNKFMLTSRSPFFKAMFQHETLESQTNVVKIKDVEPKVFKEMLLYIQTGDAPNINKMAKELLAAADYYQLDQLKISCQEVLSETLDAETSIELLILSDMYSAPKLRKDALKFVSENMNSVSSSCDWKKELAGHPSLQSEIIESLMKIMSKDDTKG